VAFARHRSFRVGSLRLARAIFVRGLLLSLVISDDAMIRMYHYAALKNRHKRFVLDGDAVTKKSNRACAVFVDHVDQGLKARSKKSTKVRAFAVAARPVGNIAHKSSGGRVHSDNTARTAPERSSGVNIHSDAIVSPT
jgi:hypothetical protein